MLWKPIPSLPGYQAASNGTIRSPYAGVLKGWVWGRYRAVELGSRGERRLVHHLVAEAFHGPRPAGLFVCHRNDIRTDNRSINLYYGTPQDNAWDAHVNRRTPHKYDVTGKPLCP